mmetsp:Transcript_1820/g.6689  ORF Transcript_1820/g.6689 Transcript_1820/m.6689 type:complete len:240 (+) Transcript_1820:108-827(+)
MQDVHEMRDVEQNRKRGRLCRDTHACKKLLGLGNVINLVALDRRHATLRFALVLFSLALDEERPVLGFHALHSVFVLFEIVLLHFVHFIGSDAKHSLSFVVEAVHPRRTRGVHYLEAHNVTALARVVRLTVRLAVPLTGVILDHLLVVTFLGAGAIVHGLIRLAQHRVRAHPRKRWLVRRRRDFLRLQLSEITCVGLVLLTHQGGRRETRTSGLGGHGRATFSVPLLELRDAFDVFGFD